MRSSLNLPDRGLQRVIFYLTMPLLSVIGFQAAPIAAQPAPEPILDIGIIQRFGDRPNDKMTLEPLRGDRLTLRFKTGEQQQMLNTAQPVTIEALPQPLSEPQLNERIVLSTHRSFESAEDSANQWRSFGIEVEIAQPRLWQVWAKREVYSTPLMRRLLLYSLRANGSRTAFLESRVEQQVPRASFFVNGYRYQRDELQITSGNGRINVDRANDNAPERLYGGSLRLQTNAYGNYTLVNRVPMETYLRGVVPHEIGLGAPPTTIQAQAILARTYALRNLRRFAIDNYQLCADTQCQVYWGLNGAAPASDRAIAATRGKVLVYRNELVDALYSSNSGGITSPFSDVWNGSDRPYLRAVVDSVANIWDLGRLPLSDERNFRTFMSRQDGFNEKGWRQFRWRNESTLEELATELRDYLRSKQHPLVNFSTVQQIRVAERAASGRIIRLAIETNLGVVELEKDEIRRALYAPKSTLFYVDPIYKDVPVTPSPNATSPNAVTSAPETSATPVRPVPNATATPGQTRRVLSGFAFVGGGFGHGVGMTQTGAYRLGDLGWSSDRILQFYYPGAEVRPLSRSMVLWRDPENPAQ